MMNFVWESLWI